MKTHGAPTAGWIQTYSGRAFCPTEPDPRAIVIEDIANALAKLCRFGGHALQFYSVAEHCVLLSDCASAENKLAGLMHDSSEAYLTDLPRPVKALLPDYRDLEDRLLTVIADKFGFAWPLSKEIKQLDNALLAAERLQNMAPMQDASGLCWAASVPLDVTLRFWSPDQAACEFLDRFETLNGERRP